MPKLDKVALWAYFTPPLLAGVAQLVEQLICNQPVGGSNPLASSTAGRAPEDRQEHGGRFPSGQRDQTVNLTAYAFGGSNPPLPTRLQVP